MADGKRRRSGTPEEESDEEFSPKAKTLNPKNAKKPRKKPSSSLSRSFASSLGSLLKADSSILSSLKQFHKEEKQSLEEQSRAHTLSVSDLNLPFPCHEVADLPSSSVGDAIERTILSLARSILAGNGFSFSIPSRTNANQVYLPDLDRIVLKHNPLTRPFANVSTVRKASITARILHLVHQLCNKGIHVTKRDLFYTDVKLFTDQGQSDAVLDDVSCLLGCTRSSLNVVASEKGVVVGRLVFYDSGDRIDCTKMGVGGKAIPPNIDRVEGMESDALFVLLVEKDAAFMRLAEDRFYNRFPCIIVTAKGQPDVATRLFLRKIRMELMLPVLALVDSDPYGLKILSVYMCGSKNMSYDSSNLTTPGIKWLGVRPSDLDKYGVPEECRLPMTEQDVKTGKDLLEEDFVKRNKGWVEELELMVRTRQKAEIQALSSFGFQYLTEVYLPLKIQQRDWL
ncbi:DNA topoisomerase 6 subunit A [Nymphaea colorata]|nr:DNA topoisomerase 6 subunit A [Nymphaea colorata]XP_031485934.1 DNA topoisomerase 6 subunit A [Nymphaea colorata]